MNTYLRPFKYNIPFHNEYVADSQRYEETLIALASSTARDKIHEYQLHRSIISAAVSKGANLVEWNNVVSLLLHHTQKRAERGTHHSLRDRWTEFAKHFANPFTAYLDITEADRIHHPGLQRFDEPGFESLFQEVIRDNVVTDAEKSFLTEKAREYDISPAKLEEALADANPALRAFRTYISEVCRDGVVTDAERRFLEEKASAYNISAESVKTFLKKELQKARNYLILRKNPVFYQLVVLCLLIDFVSRGEPQVDRIAMAVSELPSTLDVDVHTERLRCFLGDTQPVLVDLVRGRLGHQLPGNLERLDPIGWVAEFGFELLPHSRAATEDIVAVDPDEWHSLDIDFTGDMSAVADEPFELRIRFDGFDYCFAEAPLEKGLFQYRVNGSKVEVSVSPTHPLYSNADRQSMYRLIMTLIAAKLMDERIAIDDYFDALHFVQQRYAKETQT